MKQISMQDYDFTLFPVSSKAEKSPLAGFFFSFIHPAADYWVFFCAQTLEYKTQSLFSKSFATIQEELA